MQKRHMPEFIAIPLVVVVLGVLFVVMFASDAGVGAWLLVGAVLLALVVVVAVIAMRRPRGVAAAGDPGPFTGGRPSLDDDVHRVLLVVDGACTADELAGVLRTGEGRTEVFAVAPAVSSRTARWTGDEDAYSQAEQQLAATVEALAGLGVAATGHIGPHDPLQATDDGLREFPADEVVFVLRADDCTGWLENGVVEAARARYSIGVRELTLTAPAA
jgi:hypothetical protein